MSLPGSHSNSRLLKKPASLGHWALTISRPCARRLIRRFAHLASLRGSTYGTEYDSLLRLLRPRWTTLLNSLRGVQAPQAGFTLVEVLVAIALLATIGAMVFGSLVTTTQVADAGRAHATKEQTIRLILRLMADELSISRNVQAFPWVGVNGTQDGQPADTIAFLALSDSIGSSSARESETIRVVYTREKDRLMRFSRRNIYGLTDESVDQTELATRVKAFNVRYFDGQTRVWTDEWSTGTKIPKALVLEVTFQSPDTDPWTIREWVTIGAS